MATEKEHTHRKVYVLPNELVERIAAFQADKNLPSEVEAVRRLLDEALKYRDTANTIIRRFQDRLKSDGMASNVAKDVLFGHPLITTVSFPTREAVDVNIKDYGLFRIFDSGKVFEERGGYGETKWVEYSPDYSDDVPF